jgi:hypothetical protein
MATLLSARRPIVANTFAAAAELAQLAPATITLLSDTDMTAYREAILNAIDSPPAACAFDSVLEQRSPEAVAAHYVSTLRSSARIAVPATVGRRVRAAVRARCAPALKPPHH